MGSIFTAKYSVPLLKKRGGGVIAFNSSLASYGTPAEFSLPIGSLNIVCYVVNLPFLKEYISMQ
jgi:hypothetical protein